MTEIGAVIDGKYEILKEIGRGGMSIVYLAMDKRLNKQWAVKEIRKKGIGKNDEIVINSLLTEANMMKKLDHPALPRIVDIIDNGVTIYIVMDYIEGESLDKILNEYGAQPEEMVIAWAKQLCDVLSYLHYQKPPIIYRDMKPANIMLKPEGNIKIIDFGIAREYKEQNLADTTVLGTKGYAPPEQYSGQTDPRSDIFALGMTMHHLLTGVDPRNGEPYAPVRQWNPEVSEGIEIIIDRCVEPAAENRYQSCSDLLYDLEHPELITKGFKKRQKRRLTSFVISAGLCIVMAITGFILNWSASYINNRDYDSYIDSKVFDEYLKAMDLAPGRVDAYYEAIGHLETTPDEETLEEDITELVNKLYTNKNSLDVSNPEVARVYYYMGRLYLAYYDNGEEIINNAKTAKKYFEWAASDSVELYDYKLMAEAYKDLCDFITNETRTRDNEKRDYETMLETINNCLSRLEESKDDIGELDEMVFYYFAAAVIRDNAGKMAKKGIEEDKVLELMEQLYENTCALPLVDYEYEGKLQEKLIDNYEEDVNQVKLLYNEYQGGN